MFSPIHKNSTIRYGPHRKFSSFGTEEISSLRATLFPCDLQTHFARVASPHSQFSGLLTRSPWPLLSAQVPVNSALTNSVLKAHPGMPPGPSLQLFRWYRTCGGTTARCRVNPCGACCCPARPLSTRSYTAPAIPPGNGLFEGRDRTSLHPSRRARIR